MAKSQSKAILLLLLTILLGLQVSCDPGWRYMLRTPSSKQIGGKQNIQYHDLSINTRAWYFSLGSNIELEITTEANSISIVPQYAFVTSVMDSTKNRIPYDVVIALTRSGKEIYKKAYTLTEKKSHKVKAITTESFEKGTVTIHYRGDSQEERISRTITKEEYLSPLTLRKGDIMKVHFRFIGFGSCSKSIGFDPQCQDIKFHYNIKRSNRPLELSFISITDK